MGNNPDRTGRTRIAYGPTVMSLSCIPWAILHAWESHQTGCAESVQAMAVPTTEFDLQVSVHF